MASLVAQDTMMYMMYYSNFKFLDYMSYDVGSDVLDQLNTLASQGVNVYDKTNDAMIKEKLGYMSDMGKIKTSPVFVMLAQLRILAEQNPAKFGIGSVPFNYVTDNTMFDQIGDFYQDKSKELVDGLSGNLWKLALPIVAVLYLWKK